MTTTQDDVQLLRSAGRRVTAVRLAVLEQVGAQPHADVETIFRAVDNQLGSVSRQAVYDTLRSLVSASLVRRVESRRFGPGFHPPGR